MLERSAVSLTRTIDVLRAVGEPTRFRLLALLSKCDLTVTDLIAILGQSQPRISRHLKLLTEAGLVERYQEGAWAFFCTIDDGPEAAMVRDLLAVVDNGDPQFLRDNERLEGVRRKRAERAETYFSDNAAHWDELRKLHIDEAQVEKVMLALVGNAPVQNMLDMGTGTGRMLELFSDIYVKATGIDASADMLSIARSTVDKAGLNRAQVRQANITMLPTKTNFYDLVTIHQVLHYLDDPMEALMEAAKALAPGGRLLVVDFAPHSNDELRTTQAHIRLGFSHRQMKGWLEDAGLEVIATRDLVPEKQPSSSSELLTVSFWLARDRRIQIADEIGLDGIYQNDAGKNEPQYINKAGTN